MSRLTAGDDTVSVITIRQDTLWKKLKEFQRGPDISSEIKMYYWGNVDEPFQAYYGQIAASDLAELYKTYGQRLFAQNVREFLGNNDINAGIAATVKNNPEAFWYFHNGITILAKKIRKKLIGGNERASGNFEVEGIEIVNGAQTVGILGTLINLDQQLAGTRVPVRMIFLEQAPSEFSKQITIANNTQNKILAKDFASLDQNQERLFFELKEIKVEYLFRSSIRTGHDGDAITLEDAAIALACSNPDVELAVIAKSAIGRIWDTTTSGSYTRIFNTSVTGIDLWRLVQMLKASEAAIQEWKLSRQGRELQFANYMNRLIEHCLYMKHSEKADNLGKDANNSLVYIRSQALDVCSALYTLAEKAFPGCYYASLSKNISRCRQLSKLFLMPTPGASKKVSTGIEKLTLNEGSNLVKQ